MDFVLHSLLDGGRIRMLTVVDIFSRDSPTIETDRSLNRQKVVRALERATRRYDYPEVIQVENGSELQSKALDTWASAHHVKLDFIRPGNPVDNCFIESFSSQLRDACQNANVFVSSADA